MERYRKVRRYICTAFKVIMAALLFVLVVLATVQVVTRYFVAVTIIWVEELSVVIMTWMCAIGIAWVWLENCSHIRMDILDSVLPNKIIRWMDVIIDAVTAVISVAVIRIGIRTVSVNKGLVMSVINLDEGYRYLPVIAGGVLLLFASCYMMVEHLYRVRHPEEEEHA